MYIFAYVYDMYYAYAHVQLFHRMFRFIQTAESLKPSCISDSKIVNPDKSELEDYYPQIGMYILYVSMYACVCMYVCMYVRTYVRMYVRTYVCTYVCMYVCTYICMYVYTCMRMYVHTYVRMYVYMYVRIYTFN